MLVVGLVFRSFCHLHGVCCKPKIIHGCLTFPHQISGPPAFLAEEAAVGGIMRANILLVNSGFIPEAHLGNKHRHKRIKFLT